MSALINSSIARKVVMALSGLFLVVFLTQHFTINFISVVSPDAFNEWSHLMGYNPLIQFVLQPVLIAGIIVHFVMGIILEIRNNRARQIKYKKFSGNSNSTWASRNMIVTGLVVLAFLGLHLYDFWIHELNVKYVDVQPEDPGRYHGEMVEKFESLWRTVLYVLAFVLLAVHLWHGFSSSFQSMGWNNKFSKGLNTFTKLFAVLIPLGFAFIAIYHHLNPITH